MDWMQLLTSGLKTNADLKPGFKEPATEDMLITVKEQLGLEQLPPELDALYKQTNGVDYCLFIESINELIVSGSLIWNTDRVIESNSFHRTSERYKKIYKSFDNLFFFADAGNGDQFAFETRHGKFERTDIYIWDHEDDSREWLAPNLKTFIEGWFTGAI